MNPLDAMVAGEVFVDLIMTGFDFWPQPGMEAFARAFHREIGGGTAITASGLAKLGSRAGVFGVIGSEWGGWVTGRLSQNEVDTSAIEFDADEPTGFSVVASSPQDRAFLSYAGANRHLDDALRHAATSNRFSAARHVHLACAPPLASAPELLEAIRRNGCTVSLDVGWHEPWLADPRAMALLPMIDIFFPNELEARVMTGEANPQRALARYRDAGAPAVALKLGAAGAALFWHGSLYRVGPHPANPRDTTGAGDCFDAGFLHSWLHGAPAETCLRAANICGALSTEAHGGIAGFPSPERLRRELALNICEK